MTAGAKQFIEEFEALPDPLKREVLAELLRVAGHLDDPALSDDEHSSAANEVLLVYDQREADE